MIYILGADIMVKLCKNGNIHINRVGQYVLDNDFFNHFCTNLRQVQCFDINYRNGVHIFISSLVPNKVYYVFEETIDSYRMGNTIILKAIKPNAEDYKDIRQFFS